MNDANPSRWPEPAMTTGRLTEVELTWIEQRIEHWIRFGHDVEERIIDRRRRVLSFPPDSVFAFVRWASNDHGTVFSHIAILRAVAPGQPYQTMPAVRPGGEILLAIGGWPKVERVLQAIDAIDAFGIDPAAVSPDHWQHVHNRLTAGQEPRGYTPGQHRAFLLRRRATP
ncbi:DUF2840 domain-containing protein [Azospirillum agricola]|uniref:DUF2840 domain-containing protein n=1 Tax=Azospirillum agricola TaxID=1720247 RepID=UPI000A0F3459|nr:DUF2840 domain-containing protein [Azospirillum agricola]SMH43376.1 Protein of unknown function [Azospirillum lipoferum]